jgi:hypothetical protein
MVYEEWQSLQCYPANEIDGLGSVAEMTTGLQAFFVDSASGGKCSSA